MLEDGQSILAVYNGSKFAGAGSSIAITEEIAPFEVKNIQISEFDYSPVDGLVPTAKILMWEDLNSLKPILEPVVVQ